MRITYNKFRTALIYVIYIYVAATKWLYEAFVTHKHSAVSFMSDCDPARARVRCALAHSLGRVTNISTVATAHLLV